MLDEAIQKEIIQKGRDFLKSPLERDPYEEAFESDQDRKLPQPPLVKAPMAEEGERIALTRDFSGLALKNDLVSLIRDRRSARIYTNETMTLDELSFLLWATQGIKKIRGKAYATIRTVPCGEFLHPIEDIPETITQTLCGQKWAAKANVVFYWSVVPYRAEWRYGIYAHRIALIDAGHVGQALYTACTGLGLGTCGLGAFQHEKCCDLFGLDGEEEYIIYTAPVGTIRDEDLTEENAFYQFVEDEGL